jgi:DNA-binding Xre family transcriptional regulator
MNLQEQIVKSGKTNKDFAEEIGTDAPMVSRFIHYKCLPVPEMMRMICNVLKCTIEDIYTEKEISYAPTKRKKTKKFDGYKLTVRLPKEAQEFLKKALKKCGYRDITDWILRCYAKLQKQYEIIESKEKEKALRENEKPKC